MPVLSSFSALYTVQGSVIQSARVLINLINMTPLNLMILHLELANKINSHR